MESYSNQKVLKKFKVATLCLDDSFAAVTINQMLRWQHVILYWSGLHQIHGLHILRQMGHCFPRLDPFSGEIQPLYQNTERDVILM